MDDGSVALLVELFVASSAVFMFADYFRGLRRARAPSTPIAAATDGSVESEGTVKVVGEPLHDPLVGCECVLWDVEIIAGHGGEAPKVIAQQRLVQDFLVDDGTGRALVRCRENGRQLDLAILRNESPVHRAR